MAGVCIIHMILLLLIIIHIYKPINRFDKCFKNSIKVEIDADGYRMEIMCNQCDGHLGHVFLNEGFDTSKKSRSNQRHCVNSISVKYKNEDIPKELQEDILDIKK